MESLATPLALTEFFGGLIVIGLLVAAIWRRRRVTAAIVLAVVFGIVFADPVGVVATRAQADPRPLTPSPQVDRSVHWLKVAGVPIAWFAPYDQEHPWSFENSPASVLKLRYGLSFLPSTGASSVVEQCDGTITIPCWHGRPDDYPLVQNTASGETMIVPLTQDLSQEAGSGSVTYFNVPHFYDVSLGVASTRAFGYTREPALTHCW